MFPTLRCIVRFYAEGFRSMTALGRTLWIVVLVKLFVMFAVLKLFSFPISGRQERRGAGGIRVGGADGRGSLKVENFSFGWIICKQSTGRVRSSP